MSRQPSLDIIIVNWNTGTLLRDCLKSIFEARAESFILRRVVVVDNNSADGSANGLEGFAEQLARGGIPLDEKARLPLDKGGLQGVRGDCTSLAPSPAPLLVQGEGTSFLKETRSVLRNDANRGFAVACNQGAAGTQADYLLFLNPDTRMFPDSVARPLSFLEQEENARFGICGVRHVDDSGAFSTSCARFPTLRIFFGQMTGLSRLFPNGFPLHLMRESECMESREVDQVIGAFFLVRRSLFETLGGFDPRFFVYFEEVDFSLRARQEGFRSYYLATTTAYHKGGGSSQQAKAARLFYSLRSRLLYGFKHYSFAQGFTLAV